MSVRKRRWTTRRGEAREAWIVDYADQPRRHEHIADVRAQEGRRRPPRDGAASTSGRATHVGAEQEPQRSQRPPELWIARVEADGRERATVRHYRQHVDLHISPAA